MRRLAGLRRFALYSLLPALVLGGAVAFAAATAVVYVVLLEQRAAVEEAWSRLEASWQRRLELVEGLLGPHADGLPAAEGLERVREEAAAQILTPRVLEDPPRLRRILGLEARLSSEVERAGDSPDPTVRAVAASIAEEERRSAELKAELRQAAGRFNATLSRGVYRWIGPLLGFRPMDVSALESGREAARRDGEQG